MPSESYLNRKKEEFRFFDDLHPRLRQFIREAYYSWNPGSLMVDQHRAQGNEDSIEDIYADYKEKDEHRFHEMMSAKFRSGYEPAARDGE